MDASPTSWEGMRVLAIGHSTLPIEEFLHLLVSNGVRALADVRTVPRSRHNPQFEQAALRDAVEREGIGYRHLPRLGGFRKPRPDSPNAGWRNASFRGYADYMLTEEFEAGLGELRALAEPGAVALMCAEAVPWRCHRSLIADALLARGARAEHVTGPGRTRPHELTAFARIDGERVSYPPDPARSGGRREAALAPGGPGRHTGKPESEGT